MKRFLILALTLAAILSPLLPKAEAGGKVLYFTHEPGKWHKYTPQKEIFLQIAEKAGWEVTVQTGEHEPQVEWLRTKDFGKGYDAIVYNFCFAQSADLEAASNLMDQTRINGVPAILLHCSMHSWWPTYKSTDKEYDYAKGGSPDPLLFGKWEKTMGDKPFPSWGNFTGVASVRHGPKLPITLKRSDDNPVTAGLPDGYATGDTELYNNVYVGDDVVPLIKGSQEGQDDAVVMWTAPRGKSRIVGLSWGHDVRDFESAPFQQLLTDAIDDMIANPGPEAAK